MSHRIHLPLVRIAALVAVIAGSAVAVPAAATDRVVVVQPGDTLSQIALEHGLTVAQLSALNGIRDPNRIYAGQRLRLTPPPAGTPALTAMPKAKGVVHVVAWGETLTGIARRYGSTVSGIAAANGIANPSYLRVGQRLTIPGTAAPAASKKSKPAAAPATARAIHVVASGETLTGIARRYGSTISAIAAANAIANPSFLRVGQRLVIPGTSASPPAPSMPAGMASLVAARREIGNIIRAEARAQGVSVAFAQAVAWQESGWQAGAVSRAGAVGVMQLTPPTADWVAVTMLGHRIDLYDARSNVQAGVALLRHYLERYHGDRKLVLAAYFQGQTAADRHGVYPVTRPYIASILALERFFAG
ncbi:MAG TPA: LysM peptidoglycan-binding domain-containing protein [Candidatus Limnocylindria bacterium]|jgi:LysM repeat protein|nr:LysM peptidoglycan-binding domain-containing protein [Candidatus Limnocylindria bacterium]